MSSGKKDTHCDGGSNVAGILDGFSKAAKSLLQPSRQFLELYAIVRDHVEEAGRNIGVDVDPQVAMVIEDLKVVLHEVGCKVELYVSACRDMAEYVTDDGLMDEVTEDLDAGSTEELKDFVEDVSGFMEACITCLGNFSESEAKFGTELKGKAEQWDTKQCNKARRERISKTVAVATGIGAVAVGTGGVGVALIATGIGAPLGIAAIASLSIVGGSGVVAGAAGGGVAAAFAIDAGITHQQKVIFADACNRVVQFYEVLAEVQETALTMEKNMQAVTRHIDGTEGHTTQGLRDHAENPKMKIRKSGETTLRHARVIKISLKSLCRAMEDVLSEATNSKERIRVAKETITSESTLST